RWIRFDTAECPVESIRADAGLERLVTESGTPLGEAALFAVLGGAAARLHRGFQAIFTTGGQYQEAGRHGDEGAAQGSGANGQIGHVSGSGIFSLRPTVACDAPWTHRWVGSYCCLRV